MNLKVFLLLSFLIHAYGICYSSGIDTLLTAEEIIWINENKDQIRFAPNPSWPPTDYKDDEGVHQGIVSDYIKIFEGQLDISFKNVSFNDWGELLEGLSSSKADFVGAIHKTPEREKFLNFTEQYLEIPVVILVRNDYPNIINFDNIHKMKLAGVRDYASIEYIKSSYPKTEVMEFKDDLTALMQTSLGNTDGTVIDLLTASFLVEKYGITNLALGLKLDYEWNIRFGTTKDMPILNSILNKLLSSIDETKKNEIYGKWVNIKNLQTKTFYERNYKRLIYLSILILVIFIISLLYNYFLKKQVKLRTTDLKVSKERYEYATKASSDAIWDLDMVKKELYWGAGFYVLFGYKSIDTKVDYITRAGYIHPEDKERVLKSIEAVIESKENIWAESYRYMKCNGDYAVVSDKAIVIRNDKGKAVRMVGAIQDITERKKYIKAIEDQNHQLREIAWIQSHKVRAPLARMMGLINLIQINKEIDVSQNDLLQHIVSSAHELDTIIGDIVRKTKNIKINS